jgi:uncharacterized protein YjbI with pentapeptide repeats
MKKKKTQRMSPLPQERSADDEVEQPSVEALEAAHADRIRVPKGLVRADQLPSAADVMAELFPEGPAQISSRVALNPPGFSREEDWPYKQNDEGSSEREALITRTAESRSHDLGMQLAPSGDVEAATVEAELQFGGPWEASDRLMPLAMDISAADRVSETEPSGEQVEGGARRVEDESVNASKRRISAPFGRLASGIRSFLVGGRQARRKISRQNVPASSETSLDPNRLASEVTLGANDRSPAIIETTQNMDGAFEKMPEAFLGLPADFLKQNCTAPDVVGEAEERSTGSNVLLPVEGSGGEVRHPMSADVEDTALPQEGSSSMDRTSPAEPSSPDLPHSERGSSELSAPHERAAQDASTSVTAGGGALTKEELADAVDLIEEDNAIALAIDRYANVANPAPTDIFADASPDEPLDQSLDRGLGQYLHQRAVGSVGIAGEQIDINAVLEIPRDLQRAGEQAAAFSAAHASPPEHSDFPAPALSATTADDEPFAAENRLLANVPAHELSENGAAAHSPDIPYRDWSFEEKLASHHEWMESKGTIGKKADLAGADLEGSDLIGADLRFADLHDANLRAADLLMSDLRDACLVRTTFRDSCLVGANLEAANLEGALLDTAMGLVPRQLAGANLREASLPQSILQFEALGEFKRSSRQVHGFFVVMMSMSALSAVLIWMTKDFQLLTNSAVLFFLRSPAAAAALPTVQFYLAAPVALFILYLVFQFHLQHLWDLVLELPAVFPDGRTLGENEPRIVVGLLRAHFRWMNVDAPSTRLVEKAISGFLAHWVVPVTLLVYWMRFLTLQELRGTVLQELLVVASVGVALYSTTKVGRPAERWTLQENVAERFVGRLKEINAVKTAVILLGVLTFLAAGTMMGVPHGKDRAPQFMAGSIRRWGTSVLWSFGIDPYADLTEAVISTKPANWNGADNQVSTVKGARLNDANFRYALAYRAFLANAHLLRANFQGAFLSQADLRESDMGQSNLKYAILDQAQMNHVNLDRAVLDGANLSRADLRTANLSYTSLVNASLVDAHLEEATLYGAKLMGTTLIRTNFEKADLRESHLEGANLEHADIQGAYLWSAKLMGSRLTNAQLGSAIFIDADLRNADLRWAHLAGTVLTGADLTGANLDGADFRGAVGFGTNQICSAKSRHGLLLDDAMQSQVTAQCGAGN